ncbi:MAG: N-acetylmuramoyl-L-alanine amidase-like domain-containing protein [Blastocatellia bacterium]
MHSNRGQDTLSSRDAAFVRGLLGELRAEHSIRRRAKLLSARFLGAPYLVHPLIGSVEEPEQFVIRFDGFDCVTYIETVLALAHARDAEDFTARLRAIRYEEGVIDWRKRLHYTTDWAAWQIRQGLLKDMTLGEGTIPLRKTLDFLPDLPPRAAEYRYFPKQSFGYVSRWLIDTDLIYFLSVRRTLDTNHIGMIIREGEKVMVRHARQKQGKAVEQILADFIRISPSPGFIINRIAAE